MMTASQSESSKVNGTQGGTSSQIRNASYAATTSKSRSMTQCPSITATLSWTLIASNTSRWVTRRAEGSMKSPHAPHEPHLRTPFNGIKSHPPSPTCSPHACARIETPVSVVVAGGVTPTAAVAPDVGFLLRRGIACFLPVSIADVRISRATLLFDANSGSGEAQTASTIDVLPSAAVNSNSGGNSSCTTRRHLAMSCTEHPSHSGRNLAAKPDLRIDLVIVGGCVTPALGDSATLHSRLALLRLSDTASSDDGVSGASFVRSFVDAAANSSGVSGAGVVVTFHPAMPDVSASSDATSAMPSFVFIGVASVAALVALLCCSIGGGMLVYRFRRQGKPSGRTGPAHRASPTALGGEPMTQNPMHARRRRVSIAPPPTSDALQSPLRSCAASAKPAHPLSPPTKALMMASADPHCMPMIMPAIAAASSTALGYAVSRNALSAVRRKPAVQHVPRDGPTGDFLPLTLDAQSASLPSNDKATSFVPVFPPPSPVSSSFVWNKNPLQRLTAAASVSSAELQPRPAFGAGDAGAASTAVLPSLVVEAESGFNAWKDNPIVRRAPGAALRGGGLLGHHVVTSSARASDGSAPSETTRDIATAPSHMMIIS